MNFFFITESGFHAEKSLPNVCFFQDEQYIFQKELLLFIIIKVGMCLDCLS